MITRNKQGQIQSVCVERILDIKKYDWRTGKAIFQKDAIWRQGDKGLITVTFGNGAKCDGCDPAASWSLVGKQSVYQSPSMNLGFIDPPWESFIWQGKSYTASAQDTRNYCNTTPSSCSPGWVPGATVLHETGHALGMLHEHQNNLGGLNPIKLNAQAVTQWYSDHGMDAATAQTNVLDWYSCMTSADPNSDPNCNYMGSSFDPYSIMLYALPDTWLQGYPNVKNPTKPNFVLSDTDKKWLVYNYPPDSKNMPVLTVQFVDPNPPDWKMPWVQKVITEQLAPLIGVVFKFIDSNGNALSDTSSVSGTASTGASTASVSTTPTTASTTPAVQKPKKYACRKTCKIVSCDYAARQCVVSCKTVCNPSQNVITTQDTTSLDIPKGFTTVYKDENHIGSKIETFIDSTFAPYVNNDMFRPFTIGLFVVSLMILIGLIYTLFIKKNVKR